MELVILAGGFGTRFGGTKQIEEIDGTGHHFLMDYTIYDAVKAGVKKIIIVVQKNNLQIFKETILVRWKKFCKICFAIQKMSKKIKNRTKPFGTGNALLCAKKFVRGNFVVVNADDYYGKNVFKLAKNFFENNKKDYCNITYPVGQTLSNFGNAKRGICEIKNKKIIKINDFFIIKNNKKLFASDENNYFEIKKNTQVSMNFWCFKKNIFNFLKKEQKLFFKNEFKLNFLTSEFMLTKAINNLLANKKICIENKLTKSTWFGLTFFDDKKEVEEKIAKLLKQKKYVWK